MKILKYTFKQSFKLHNYWKKTHTHTHAHKHTHICTSTIYNLHKRHGQISGFQDIIFDLKMLRFSESLMLLGKHSRIFGPRKHFVSEP